MTSSQGIPSKATTLEERLAALGPRFPDSSIESVSGLVQFDASHPNQRVQWARFLKEEDDWELYFSLYSEWEGLSPEQLRKNGGRKASDAMQAFDKWLRKNCGSQAERRKVRYRLFPPQRKERTGYELADWENEYHSHPEWHDRSRSEMIENVESGARSFAQGYILWVNDRCSALPERREYFNRFFRFDYEDWSEFNSAEDWAGEYQAHKDWQSKSVGWLCRDSKTGGRKFYDAALNWLDRQNLPPEERKKVWKLIFHQDSHIKRLYNSLKDRIIDSLPAAREAVRDYRTSVSYCIMKGKGLEGIDSLSRSPDIVAILLFPQLLNEWVDLVRSGAEKQDFRDFFGGRLSPRIKNITSAVGRYSMLKFAEDAKGRFLLPREYSRFIQQVFVDEQGTVAALGEEAPPSVESYLAKCHPDFSGVTVLEERVDSETKNPNLRFRMLLATKPALSSDAALDSFVKFYADESERDLDVLVNNYLLEVCGMKCVGRARQAELQQVKFPRQPMKNLATVYTSADNLENLLGEPTPHALITPFVTVTTLADYLSSSEADILETLALVNQAACVLHQSGYLNLSNRNLSEAQKKALSEKVQEVSYQALFQRFVSGEGSRLYQLYLELGVAQKLDEYKKRHLSFVLGDMHPGNVLVTSAQEVMFVDFERVHLGLAQEDLAACLINRTLAFSPEQREKVVDDYACKSGLLKKSEREEFISVYHLAMLQKGLEICRYLADRPGLFSSESCSEKEASQIWRENHDYYLGEALTHALRAGYSSPTIARLRAAAEEALSPAE